MAIAAPGTECRGCMVNAPGTECRGCMVNAPGIECRGCLALGLSACIHECSRFGFRFDACCAGGKSCLMAGRDVDLNTRVYQSHERFAKSVTHGRRSMCARLSLTKCALQGVSCTCLFSRTPPLSNDRARRALHECARSTLARLPLTKCALRMSLMFDGPSPIDVQSPIAEDRRSRASH